MQLLAISNNLKRASFRQRIEVYLDILRDADINCKVVLYPRGNWARWKLLRSCLDFDVVLLHKKTLNFFDAFWLRRYARKVIYNFDDAIMYYDEHPERTPSRRKHQKPFERTLKLADMVIAGNSYLAEHAKKFNSNVEILPTGLDTGAYNRQTKAETDDIIRLVWIGSRSTLKYLLQIKPALEEIGSRFDKVVLRIVCDDFFDLQNMKVEKHQWSLETQEMDLATSDIGLAPLPDNRFTRGKCGFKILQYASAGLPAVASPVGVNTELIKSNVNGFLAADITQWIDRITQLVENRQLMRKMGEENQAVAKNFDINIIGEQLSQLIRKCLDSDV